MVAAIAATVQAHPLAGSFGEGFQHSGRDATVGRAVEQCAGAVRIGPGLIAGGLEGRDPLLEVCIIQIGNAGFDSIVETLEPLIGVRGALVEFGDVCPPFSASGLPAVKNARQDGFQPLWSEETFLKVIDHQIIELGHWHRHTGTGG